MCGGGGVAPCELTVRVSFKSRHREKGRDRVSVREGKNRRGKDGEEGKTI